jgi:GTP cyclohydrolase IA
MPEMLVRLGDDPQRDGLRDTPEHLERSMEYLTKGYQENPEQILLGAMFDVAYDEMVTVKDIEMFSLCEHHFLPFFGKVHVAYIPRGSVLGSVKCLAWWTYLRVDCRCRSVSQHRLLKQSRVRSTRWA